MSLDPPSEPVSWMRAGFESAITAAPCRNPRLRLLCVGAGRDGSQSITRMFRESFAQEGAGRQVAHEYASQEFGNSFANYQETNDPAHLHHIRRLIEECPFDCIVGAGYAPILQLFREICGPELGLIHIRRRDRDAAINSLMENCEYFPAAYKHYSASPEAVMKRMAGFHFGDLSHASWEGLTLRGKIAWYFDTTHALIDTDAGLFAHRLELNTEHLNHESSRRLIARLVLGNDDWLPAPVHLNTHAYLSRLPDQHRPKMQWLMGQLDFMRAAHDDAYPIEYFLNAFIAWTGYQIRRSEQIGLQDCRTDEELDRILERAIQAVEHTRSLIEDLKMEHSAKVRS